MRRRRIGDAVSAAETLVTLGATLRGLTLCVIGEWTSRQLLIGMGLGLSFLVMGCMAVYKFSKD